MILKYVVFKEKQLPQQQQKQKDITDYVGAG